MGRGVIIALAALLFVSVGINVFTLGHMSGRAIAGHHPGEKTEHRGSRGGFEDPFKIMRYADELSPELRQQFRESFREQLPTMREDHRKVGALHRELGVLMSAEEWDDAAISAKLDEIQTIKDSQHQAFTDAFISAFKTLPAAERGRLIEEANKRRMERRQRRKEGRKDRRPPPEDK